MIFEGQMKKQSGDFLDFDRFVSLYMRDKDDSFRKSNKPIQVYPLSMAAKYITVPTPLFRAQFNFLLLFEAGGGAQQIDSEEFPLRANDVLFVREGHLNAIKSIKASTSGYYLHIDNSVLPRVFPSTSLLSDFTFNPKRTVTPPEMRWLCSCCKLMEEATEGELPGVPSATVPLLTAMVARLSRGWSASVSKADRQTQVAASFRHLLYDHFLRQRDVGFYASSLGLSENYLTRCLKSVTGRSPKQHIQEIIISHSKIMLQDDARDISQIAFALNFSDPAYFGRLFKQITGQTPFEYRSTVRNHVQRRCPE